MDKSQEYYIEQEKLYKLYDFSSGKFKIKQFIATKVNDYLW